MPAKCAIPGVDLMYLITESKTSRLLAVEAASGNSKVTYNRPSSSVGIKPVALL